MASGRRGGPPDLKSTLGSLLRTTLEQVGAVKDVAKQQARARGGLLDQALVQRRRKDALAKLGESVYRLSRRGELGELALDPEIAMALADVDASEGSEFLPDDRLDPLQSLGEELGGRGGPEAVSSRDYRPPLATARRGEARVWRPVMPDDQPGDEAEGDTQQDLAAPAAVLEAEANESASHEAQDDELESDQPTQAEPNSPLRMTRRSARRGASGGISFAEEEPRVGDEEHEGDLQAYMHDDDVPE